MIKALKQFGNSDSQAFPAPEERLFPAAFWPVKKRQKKCLALSVKKTGRLPAIKRVSHNTASKENPVRSAQKGAMFRYSIFYSPISFVYGPISFVRELFFLLVNIIRLFIFPNVIIINAFLIPLICVFTNTKLIFLSSPAIIN